MVTWMAQKAVESAALTHELQRRMMSLRTGKGRVEWKPF